MFRAIKRIFVGGTLTVVALVFVDLLSGYFLFFYQQYMAPADIWAPGERRYLAYAEGPLPAVSVVATLVEKLSPKAEPPRPDVESADAKVLIHPDPEFGWRGQEGVHRFVFSKPRDKYPDKPPYHDWTATILSDGGRATSRNPVDRTKRMVVFGDSWIFGWALDDEMTFAWQLQSEYRDYFRVQSYATAGWGHAQALIEFRKLAPTLTPDDVLIFGYAQFLLPRNAPQPSVVESLASGLVRYREAPDKPLLYPGVSIDENGKAAISRIPLDCAKADGYCDRDEFSLAYLEDVTNRLFDEIIEATGAKIYVLLVDGPEDRVIQHLRQRGVTVVDARPKPGFFQQDTMAPYDAHPGPISHHHWFSRMRPEIDRLVRN